MMRPGLRLLADNKLLAQPGWRAQKPRRKLVLGHVWVRLGRLRALVAYLTQHGSRLNRPVLVALVHTKPLWAVLVMLLRRHVA